MEESRDRLSRVGENALLFGHPRQRSDGLTIFRDEAEAGLGNSFRWGATPMNGFPLHVTRGSFQTAATRGRRGGRVTRGQNRGGGSDLPSWYPRVPLRDITAISRAIERRRARIVREHEEDPQNDSPIPPQEQIHHEPLLSAQFEHSLSLNHNTSEGTDDYSTPEPEKKHINHIDSVEKSILEEIRMLKSTPSAKKSEKARKIRTLMSSGDSFPEL